MSTGERRRHPTPHGPNSKPTNVFDKAYRGLKYAGNKISSEVEDTVLTPVHNAEDKLKGYALVGIILIGGAIYLNRNEISSGASSVYESTKSFANKVPGYVEKAAPYIAGAAVLL